MCKKGLLLVLAVCLVLTALPMGSIAAETVYLKDFNDGTFSSELRTYCSDPPASGVPADMPLLDQVADKKLVYDTAAVAGKAYPKANATTVSYPRLNVDVSGKAIDGDIYTYETDLLVDKNFVNTKFIVRYGAASWTQGGAMNDTVLFEIKADGKLYCSNFIMPIELGRFYRISAVVDLSGDNATKSLYVDGGLVTADKPTVYGTGSTAKKAFCYSITSYPHTGAAADENNLYVDTKLLVDNIRISKGNAFTAEENFLISGDSVIYKSKTGSAVSAQYQAANRGQSGGMVWSIEDNPAGVSVDQSGQVTVTNDAPAYFILKAALESQPEVCVSRYINVQDESALTSIDFETTQPGTIPSGWTNAMVQEEENGNRYLDASGAAESKWYKDVLLSGTATMTWRGMVKTGNTGDNFMTIAGSDTGSWYIQSKFTVENGKARFYSAFDKNGKASAVLLGYYPLDTWIDGKIELDLDNQVYSIYYNDVCVAKDYKMEDGKISFKISALITKAATDDINILKGVAPSGHPDISMDTQLYKASAGRTARIPLNSNVQNGTWELADHYDGITISEKGVLSLAGNTPEKAVGVKQTNVQTGEASVKYANLIDAKVFNFEQDTVGEKPEAFYSSATMPVVQQDPDGNKYLAAYGWSHHARLNISPLISTGVVTVESKVRVDAGVEGGYVSTFAPTQGNWYLNPRLEEKSGTATWRTEHDASGSTSGASGLASMELNKWISAKVIADFNTNSYSIYANGQPVATNFKFRNDQSIYNLTMLVFGTYVDDITYFSGSLDEDAVTLEADRALTLIPPTGKANATGFTANVQGSGTVVWGIEGEYPGVSIDSATGILTVTGQAQEGYVTVTAKTENMATPAKAAYPLRKLIFDFNNDTVDQRPDGWSGGVIQEENGNKYMHGESATKARYDLPANLTGRVVMEADIRRPAPPTQAGGAVALAVYDEKDWVTNLDLVHNDTTHAFKDTRGDFNYPQISLQGDWQHVKIVFDTVKKTYTAFVNGILVNETEVPMLFVQRDILVRMRQFIFEMDVDNLAIYHAGDVSPVAYNLNVSNLGVGMAAKANYTVFAETGEPESCSVVSWYLSENEDAGYVKVGENASYTPTAADIGKYIKFVLNPACDTAVGTEAESVPVQIKALGIGDGVFTSGGSAANIHRSNLKEGSNELSYAVMLKNSGASEISAVLAAAYYLGGTLRTIKYEPVTLPAGMEQTLTAAISAELTAETVSGSYVRFFLWDGQSMQPLTDRTDIK